MNDIISSLVEQLQQQKLKLEITILVSVVDSVQSDEAATKKEHIARCKECGWTKTYTNARASARGLRSHHNHCPKNRPLPDWLVERDFAEDGHE